MWLKLTLIFVVIFLVNFCFSNSIYQKISDKTITKLKTTKKNLKTELKLFLSKKQDQKDFIKNSKYIIREFKFYCMKKKISKQIFLELVSPLRKKLSHQYLNEKLKKHQGIDEFIDFEDKSKTSFQHLKSSAKEQIEKINNKLIFGISSVFLIFLMFFVFLFCRYDHVVFFLVSGILLGFYCYLNQFYWLNFIFLLFMFESVISSVNQILRKF